MNRAAMTVLIRRPLADVWGLIIDMDRYSVAWGEHYTVKTPGPLALGSLIEEDEGTVATVTEFDPPRRFAVEVAGGHWATDSMRIGHVLEPAEDGTRFTTWFEVTFKGWGKMLRPVLVPYFLRFARKPVYGIKDYLEAGRQDGWK